MATFLLIHGAWHGGWSFNPLIEGLESRGHQVIAPDLPLIPEEPTLARWARFAVDTARASGEKVILAGHSRGGLVVSAAAELDPDAFESLVYITAFMVPNGKTAQHFIDSAPRYEAFGEGLSVSDDGKFLMLESEAAVATMAQLCETQYRKDCAPRLQREPIEPLNAVMELSSARFGSLKRAYIECIQDRAIPIQVQRQMLREQPCDRVTTFNCDHTPMLSATSMLISALDSWAVS